jgi:hypothetical protein
LLRFYTGIATIEMAVHQLSTLLTSFPYSFSVVRRSDGEDFKRLRVSLSRRKPSRAELDPL